MYSGKYYKDCDSLPYYNFIKLAITGDVKWLVDWGRVHMTTLTDTWQSIQNEYSELSKDEHAQGHLDTLKEVYELNGRIVAIEHTVAAIKRGVGSLLPEFIEVLRNQGFRYKYLPETLERDLQLTITQTKTLKIQLDSKEAELQATQGQPATEQDYYDQLTVMSNFYHYDINPRLITVREFISKLAIFKQANTPKNGSTGED